MQHKQRQMFAPLDQNPGLDEEAAEGLDSRFFQTKVEEEDISNCLGLKWSAVIFIGFKLAIWCYCFAIWFNRILELTAVCQHHGASQQQQEQNSTSSRDC